MYQHLCNDAVIIVRHKFWAGNLPSGYDLRLTKAWEQEGPLCKGIHLPELNCSCPITFLVGPQWGWQCCWRLLEVVSGCWTLFEVVGGCYRLLEVVGGCWGLLQVDEGCWRLFVGC